MMKRFVKGSLILVCAMAVLILSGCSKREQALAGTSVLSGAAAGTSFLKGHFKRGTERKRQMKHPLRINYRCEK